MPTDFTAWRVLADLKSGDRKRSLYRAPSISVGRYIALSGAKRAHTPGLETPSTPDELGVVGGGYAMDGVGGLAAGCRV